MKKRIYDLTFKEIKEICKKHDKLTCCGCPIEKECNNYICFYPEELDLNKLKRKVEIEREIVGTTTLEKSILNAFPNIKEKVDAWDIVNAKNVDIAYLRDYCKSVEYYNGCHTIDLTEDEFELLKEMKP